VILLGLMAYPLYQPVVISLYDYGQPQASGAAPLEYLGLDNYGTLLGNPQFWDVLLATVVFAAVCVVGTLLVGTALAVLAGRARRIPRTLLFLAALGAWATPTMAGSYVWLFLFDQDFGLVNEVLSGLGFGMQGHSWTFERISAFGLVAGEIIWCSFPFVLVTMYAGITGIPREVVEAASLDGASATRTATSVLLPILRPLLAIATIQSIIWDFKVFTQIYVLQRAGAPTRETNLLGTLIYSYASEFSVAGALATIMLVITLALTGFYIRQMLKEDEL
jgi:N,N'-diacetylchitobiose transport system permease protein